MVKILGIKDYIVTEESLIDDMRPFNNRNCKKVNNQWIKNQIIYLSSKAERELGKSFYKMTKSEREKYRREKILEESDVSFDENIIKKVHKIFGVKITKEDLKGTLYNLADKILKTN